MGESSIPIRCSTEGCLTLGPRAREAKAAGWRPDGRSDWRARTSWTCPRCAAKPLQRAWTQAVVEGRHSIADYLRPDLPDLEVPPITSETSPQATGEILPRPGTPRRIPKKSRSSGAFRRFSMFSIMALAMLASEERD